MLNEQRGKIFFGDVLFIAAIMVLLIFGLAAIFSASHVAGANSANDNFSKQFYWIMIGIMLTTIIIVLPTRYLYFSAYWIYGISIVLLLMAMIFSHGESIRRWLIIGGVRFQPSELAKVATLLALSKYLSEDARDLRRLKDIAIAFLIVGLPFFLIFIEPDLGTSLVFLALVLPILYWAGLPSFYLFVIMTPFLVMAASFNYYTFFVIMIVAIALSLYFQRGLTVSAFLFAINIFVGIMTPFLWNRLHGYQKHRILTFLGIEADPYGLSYQVIQSKVAIGSGGFWGKGFLNGTQTQLRFLPAQHTDFVFSVIGEEFGFLGSFFILILFLFLILRGIYISAIVKNRFLSLLVFGAVIILAFHAVVNTGMTVGIFPVTGLPLPFLSYGGSFMATCFLLVGFILHASFRRYQYF
ncbi:rod shape-determining protein RodA [candidate division KSB1 bacterium 4484_87]|nr:MAG: rod shape-determining protein RodA [candidate division KSB1 bacterium 4484_87]